MPLLKLPVLQHRFSMPHTLAAATIFALTMHGATVFAANPGSREASTAAVLVLDASGSMWGQLEGGESKIATARAVMKDFFAQRDAATPLSVIAYGHRRRGDCADIEIIAPTGIHDAAVLSRKLSELNPRGMTPIADSLRLAASQIPASAERADIILVTDGLETCEADPCAVAEELAQAGVAIRAHVVGFGLTKQEATALSCVTKKTGGLLLRPQSGAELAAALKQIEAAAPVAPAPKAFFDIGPKAEAGHTYRISYQGSARNIDFAGFTPRGEGRPESGPSFGPIGGGTNGTNPFTKRAPLEPGEYDLILEAADGSRIIARQPIEVVPASNRFDPIGTVRPGQRFTLTWHGPNQISERIVIAKPGAPVSTFEPDWGYTLSKNGQMGLRAPTQPGTYELRYLAANGRDILFSQQFAVGAP